MKVIPWHDVKPGQTVDLHHAGTVFFSGIVDARTEDGEVIWLINPLNERRLFFSAEGLVPHLHEVTS